MKLWIKLQHWFYRMLIDYKTKKIIEFNKERENYLKTNNMKLWIARDEDSLIYLYMKKPVLITHYFDTKYLIGEIDKNLFPEVTFENSPQRVEVKLIKDYD